MINIKGLIIGKQIVITKGKKRNIDWEEAVIMAKYIGVTTPFIMKLFRIYGKKKVLSLQSYLKDNESKNLEASLVWKLQNPTS